MPLYSKMFKIIDNLRWVFYFLIDSWLKGGTGVSIILSLKHGTGTFLLEFLIYSKKFQVSHTRKQKTVTTSSTLSIQLSFWITKVTRGIVFTVKSAFSSILAHFFRFFVKYRSEVQNRDPIRKYRKSTSTRKYFFARWKMLTSIENRTTDSLWINLTE